MTLAWTAAGGTDLGRVREGNEDAFRLDLLRGIFLVADGMGGHAAGEVASRLAADAVLEAMTAAIDRGVDGDGLPHALETALGRAHDAIQAWALESPETRGMGTTLTGAVLDGNGRVHAGHIGDSRLYRFRDRQAVQLTRDHTWVRRELDAGRIRPAEARNHPFSHILTHVLTDDAEPVVDLLSAEVEPGDVLLLATDGLYNMLADGAITEIVTAAAAPPEARVTRLLEEANRAGGLDNITAVLVQILD